MKIFSGLTAITLILGYPCLSEAIPTITRDKIIDIAKSGVGCRYVWEKR